MFEDFFSSQFMPHGHCYLWTPSILWGHVISDFLIGLSYFSIPLALLYFIKHRSDLVFSGVFKLFAIFILSCCLGHFIDIWNIWYSDYWLSTIVRIITAIASVITAVALWPLIPKALKIPSTTLLKEQVKQKESIEMMLAESNKMLEKRVLDRTQELENQKNSLKRSHDIMVDREHQMIELKAEVNALCEQLNQPPKYIIVTGRKNS